MYHILLLGLLPILFIQSGCDKDDGINLNLSPSKALSAPQDGALVTLTPASSASVVFEWEMAQTADGALALYEVAFDKESGDFSNPIYKVSADGNGISNRATVSHKTLNQIANYAGIQSQATGKVKWIVLASKGTNVKVSEQSRLLQITRPAGFSELPGNVFLTGDATEAGTDASKALKMRQTANGEYELYTSLKAGNYSFIDRTTANPRVFSVDGQLIKEGGSTAITGATQVYRISLDFNNAAAKIIAIDEVGLWYSYDNNIRFTLDYAGGGVWKAVDRKIDFPTADWGPENRYKFRMKVREDGASKEEWYGSVNNDNQPPSASTPPSYFNLYPITGNDQWNHSFKFAPEVNGKNTDIVFSFSLEAAYSHQVTIR